MGESEKIFIPSPPEEETDEVTFAARGNHNAPDEGHPYLPLGEGAAPAADEGRYQVGPCTAPHPSRASPGPPSRKERVFSLDFFPFPAYTISKDKRE